MIIGFGSGDRRKLTQIHHPNKFSSTSGCIFGHLRRIASWLEFSTGPLRPNGTGWQLVRLSNPTASDAMKKPSGVKYSTALVKMASPDRIFVSHTWNYTNKKGAIFALMIKHFARANIICYTFLRMMLPEAEPSRFLEGLHHLESVPHWALRWFEVVPFDAALFFCGKL